MPHARAQVRTIVSPVGSVSPRAQRKLETASVRRLQTQPGDYRSIRNVFGKREIRQQGKSIYRYSRNLNSQTFAWSNVGQRQILFRKHVITKLFTGGGKSRSRGFEFIRTHVPVLPRHRMLAARHEIA